MRPALPGWQDWQMPAYVGPLSALTVDDNRGRSDAAFLAEPALGHGETFRDLLGAVGVRVIGSVTRRTAPQGAVPVAGLDSPPLGELLARMLLSSDNEVAESLTRGRCGAGRGGPPRPAPPRLGRAAGRLPIAADGWADGSGLSRADLRSARELRRLVQWARTAVVVELAARLPWPALGHVDRALPRHRRTGAWSPRRERSSADRR